MITVDFETTAIMPRPDYPPTPVGVAVKYEDAPAVYYAWGHPCENNCTREEAMALLAKIWATSEPLLFHNAKFDLAVAEERLGLPVPDWRRVHDTMFLVYLVDPHAKSHALKASADRMLGLAPSEQDAVKAWILANVPEATPKTFGAHISKAPGDLIGLYAVGDVDRTKQLFDHCMEIITASGMGEAYDRERRLLPGLMRAERTGIRFDLEAAQRDEALYGNAFAEADRRIRARLNADINLNSGDELAAALKQAGLVKDLPLTATGRVSTAKGVLEAAIEDREFYRLLRYRGVLKTCLGTFISPLCRQAEASGGRVHTSWHQTRGDTERGGTVTGRLSSIAPNFMNLPSDYEGCDLPDFPPPPVIRQYFLPEPGHVWLKRDYSAQEVRVLAHFENGGLMEQFQKDADMDPHQFAADLIAARTGKHLGRKVTKTVAFSILYGSGARHLSERLEVSYDEALRIKSLYLDTFPDVKSLMRDVQDRGNRGAPVRTVGKRLIYVEPPKENRSFAYKMLNHLIQGSAADITKQGIINYLASKDPEAVFLATVHDEINISVPVERVADEALVLRAAMAGVPLDVPLTSDCYVGENWSDADHHKREAWH